MDGPISLSGRPAAADAMMTTRQKSNSGKQFEAMPRPMSVWLQWLLVYLVVRAYWWMTSQTWRILDSQWVAGGLLKLMLWVVPCLTALAAWRAWSRHYPRAPEAAGLSRAGWLPGLTLGVLATLPMALVVLFGGPMAARTEDIGAAVIGAFAEEVLFRGFLFAGLRRAGWRLWPAVAVTAFAFALAHHPTNAGMFFMGIASLLFGPDWFIADLPRVLLWLAPFFAGGALFAWLTHRWGTLWPAIGLHVCVNLWWELTVGGSLASLRRVALEPLPLAHAAAVVIAIVVTLRRTGSSGDRGIGGSGDRVIG